MKLSALPQALAGLLALLAACCSTIEVVPLPTLMEVERTERGARMVLINGSDAAWTFYGYGPRQPVYSLEVEEGGVWRRDPVGWCGTGLRLHEIAPRSEVEFAVHAEREQQIRILVELTAVDGSEHTVRSERRR